MADTAEVIAAQLRERIQQGLLQPGDRLPTMEELVAQHGVSRQTARQALNLLKAEGLAEYRGGRAGTVVREMHPRRLLRDRSVERDELGYYSGKSVQHWRALPHPAGEQTRVGRAPAPADIAELLNVPPGELVTVRRRIIGDPGQPELRQLADSWIAPWIEEELPALAGKTGLGGMYDRIEEWADRPLSWREEVSARMPSPDEAEALLMPSTGVPILRAIRTTLLAERGRKTPRAVEVQDIRMSAALFAVGYPVPRGGSAKWPVAPATSDYYQAD